MDKNNMKTDDSIGYEDPGLLTSPRSPRSIPGSTPRGISPFGSPRSGGANNVVKSSDKSKVNKSDTFTGINLKINNMSEDDFKQAFGPFELADGSIYTGEFVNGMKNGYGEITFPNGRVYKGEWVNNIQNGKGTMIKTNGAQYTGKWVDGMKHGHGTYKETTGYVYIGEW